MAGASGHILLDFGAFPGGSDASYTVTGADLSVAGLTAASRVEAWIAPAATADHSADEHHVETLCVKADKDSIVPGASFDVKGVNTSPLHEPLEATIPDRFGAANFAQKGNRWPSVGGRGTRLYGKWNIGVAWSDT